MTIAATGAPVIEIAMAPKMIVTWSTTSRPYGANICPTGDVRWYSPLPMKLNRYDTPWLMNRATTANRIVQKSGAGPMSEPFGPKPANSGSVNTNTPWTTQNRP